MTLLFFFLTVYRIKEQAEEEPEFGWYYQAELIEVPADYEDKKR